MKACVTRSAQRGRAEHEVDPHPACCARSAAGSSPSRCRRPGPGRADAPRRRTPPRTIAWNAARSAGVTWVLVANTRHVPDVLVLRGDVPVADQRRGQVGLVLAPGRSPRRAAPRASAACSPGAGRRPPGRWGRRATTPGPRRRWPRSRGPRRTAGSPYSGMPSKPSCDVLDADPGDDRDAVPLVDAVGRHLVAQRRRAPSSATGRRAPWSPAAPARRCRGAAAAPRPGRSGSGRS